MFKPYPSDSRYKVGQSGQVLGLHGQLLKPVADSFGVHQTLISDIVTGKRWQHVKDKS